MIKVDGEDGQEAREQAEVLAGGEMCGTCVLGQGVTFPVGTQDASVLGRADWLAAWALGCQEQRRWPWWCRSALWPFVSLAKCAVNCHLANMFPLCQVLNVLFFIKTGIFNFIFSVLYSWSDKQKWDIF